MRNKTSLPSLCAVLRLRPTQHCEAGRGSTGAPLPLLQMCTGRTCLVVSYVCVYFFLHTPLLLLLHHHHHSLHLPHHVPVLHHHLLSYHFQTRLRILNLDSLAHPLHLLTIYVMTYEIMMAILFLLFYSF